MQNVEKAMGTVNSIVNDKLLQEDLKNLIIWVKGDVVRFVGYNGRISSATKVEALVEDNTEEEVFVQLRAKSIQDVLGVFKSLKRTQVSGIEFNITENEAIMFVNEEPIDPEMDYANEYKRVSKYRITKTKFKEAIKKEIEAINMDFEGEEIATIDLKVYLDALLPTVAKETRDGTNNIIFGASKVYTVPSSYAAMLKNELNPVMSGFRLSNSVANFLKTFTADVEKIKVSKTEMASGLVLLNIKSDTTVATIQCNDLSKAYDITPFEGDLPSGIVVDKAYMTDVLKRLSLISEAVFVTITVSGTQGTMSILCKDMLQTVPVIGTKGEGEYAFSIRPELLSSLMLTHTDSFGDNIFIILDSQANDKIVLGAKDETGMWLTKMGGLSRSKGNFAWN